MIYFWLVKIELQMPMDKDFAADYVASWRTRTTRNYNAFPDLEDFFEGDSARCLLAVFGVYSSFGHSCGSNCGAADGAIFGLSPEAAAVDAGFPA